MEIIRKIEVNNQNILVLAKDGTTYYKYLENKKGISDNLDYFYTSEITEEIYNQVMEDYKKGLIESVYGEFPIIKNPLEKLTDNGVLNLTNWIGFAYMTWDKTTNNLKYGRNRNYNESLKNFQLKVTSN